MTYRVRFCCHRLNHAPLASDPAGTKIWLPSPHIYPPLISLICKQALQTEELKFLLWLPLRATDKLLNTMPSDEHSRSLTPMVNWRCISAQKFNPYQPRLEKRGRRGQAAASREQSVSSISCTCSLAGLNQLTCKQASPAA